MLSMLYNDDIHQLTILGRELHDILEIDECYTDWFKRMVEYGFKAGVDYFRVYHKSKVEDHRITLHMAKVIALSYPSGIQLYQYLVTEENKYLPDLINFFSILESVNNPPDPKYCVYLMKYENQLIKIGVTSNFDSRYKQLNGSNGVFIDYYAHTDYIDKNEAYKLEKCCHHNFILHRVTGEYFDIQWDEAVSFLSKLSRIVTPIYRTAITSRKSG